MNLCVYGFVFVINMKTPSLRSLEDDDHAHNNLDVALIIYIYMVMVPWLGWARQR